MGADTDPPALRPARSQAPGAGLLVALGVTQIVSWGSIYYLAALLMEPLRTALGVAQPVVVGAFSLSMLVSGLAAPWVGRHIDRHGGRGVMTGGSIAAVLLLVLLSRVESVAALYAIYLGLGLAMAGTLYPPAFAVVTQAFGAGYRRAITALTLFGGFASTAFWPLTTALIEALGWRNAVLALAAINLVLCVPLHARLPRHAARAGGEPAPPPAPVTVDATAREALRAPGFVLLAVAFAGHALAISSIGVHLIALLTGRGMSATSAAAAAALIGPMQVLGRIGELALSGRASAVQVGRAITWFLPLSMVVLWFEGLAQAEWLLLGLFALLYGVGNGAMTIVRGAVPAELFGRTHYGAISGALNGPAMIVGAAAPFIASLLLDALGSYGRVLLVLAVVGAAGAVSFALATRRAPS
jgi:MFS family permease